MIEFIQDGGPFMYVILGLSVIAAAMILERFFVLNLVYPRRQNFFAKVIKKVRTNGLSSAFKMCRTTSHPLAEVVSEILKNHNQGPEAIESAANIVIQKIIPKIQRRTTYIQMMGNVSTLVGLLGTIQGLIVSFTSLAGADAASKAEILAKGISTAMNTTAFGLVVAIPCIICFTILTNKENTILQFYDETISEVIHILTHERNSGNVQSDNEAA